MAAFAITFLVSVGASVVDNYIYDCMSKWLGRNNQIADNYSRQYFAPAAKYV